MPDLDDAASLRRAQIIDRLRFIAKRRAELEAERLPLYREGAELKLSWRDLGRASGVSGEAVQKAIQRADEAEAELAAANG